MELHFEIGESFIKDETTFVVRNIVSQNKDFPYQCFAEKTVYKAFREAIKTYSLEEIKKRKEEITNEILEKEFESESIYLSDFDIMRCKYLEAQKIIEGYKSPPQSFARSAKNVGCFPYESKLVCYIEVMANGTVKDVSSEQMKKEALKNVDAGESRLFAVWPGNWRSDLFIIDDIDAFAKTLY